MKQTNQTKNHFPISTLKVQRFEAQILPRAGRNKNCILLICMPFQAFGQQASATSKEIIERIQKTQEEAAK